MDSMMGLSKTDVLDKADRIDIAGTPIWLMNPIHCLFSRVANAFGRGLGEEKYEREVVRIRAAIDICRGWLNESLDDAMGRGDVKSAVGAVNYLVRYCRTAKAREVARRTEINVADALPLDHACWTSSWELSQYRDKTLLPVHKKLAGRLGARR